MKRTLITAIVAAAILTAGCYHEAKNLDVKRSWPAAAIKKVEVRGVNGRILVDAGPSQEVTLHVTGYFTPSARQKESEILITEVKGDTLIVKEKGVKDHRWGMVFSRGKKINFQLQVPSQMLVTANTVNGRIEIAGVEGRMKLGSVNGRIEVKTPGAPVTATTVNGSIRTEFVNRFTGASMKTVNGSVSVTVPPNSSIDCDIHQVNGNFKSNIPLQVTGSPGDRDASGTIGGGEFPLEVTTVNGSISLTERTVTD